MFWKEVLWTARASQGGGPGFHLGNFLGLHKFAIVDRKVLITGSLNWTTQAIQNNRENVLIMEDEEYVRLFLEEFERIWEEFNPTRFSFFPQKERAR